MYIPTIGLEVHVGLNTRTKMFCGCPNDSSEKHPNTNTCPVCLGHPGTLPTINKEAVESVLMVGLALKSTLATTTHFDRKSYFYPDLPKGYQISQYEEPLVQGGMLNGIRIRRIHLEEDAGRLLHGESGTLVDFNRAGTPLMELVTEPDVKNADEAMAFAQALQLLLRYLGVSEADMERGEMRVEANISIRKDGEDFGTKVEVKNINSFKAVRDAINYELARQEELLGEGKSVVQETRGWNDTKHKTESQRSKESAHDYRYFPEPDLPPLDLRNWNIEAIREKLPELPEAKLHRFIREFGLSKPQAEAVTEDRNIAEYFEEAASELKEFSKEASYELLWNYLTSDLRGLAREKGILITETKVNPEEFAHLVGLVSRGTLSSRMAKDLLVKMFETGEDPEVILKSEGSKLVSDEGELIGIIREIISKNPKPVEDYKNGKQNALQFLVGQAMAKTKGQAEPAKLRALFEKELK